MALNIICASHPHGLKPMVTGSVVPMALGSNGNLVVAGRMTETTRTTGKKGTTRMTEMTGMTERLRDREMETGKK